VRKGGADSRAARCARGSPRSAADGRALLVQDARTRSAYRRRGPPPFMKLSDDEVIAEFRNAGFTLAKRLDILPYQYYLFFDKR